MREAPAAGPSVWLPSEPHCGFKREMPGSGAEAHVFKVFFLTLPSLDVFVPLRSGLRSSVREVTYSPYHRQEHPFVTGFAITKAAFSRRDWLRAYPLLDEVTRADVGSQ
jgi:hypothetical protein